MDLLGRISQVIIPVFLIVAVGWAYARLRPVLFVPAALTIGLQAVSPEAAFNGV